MRISMYTSFTESFRKKGAIQRISPSGRVIHKTVARTNAASRERSNFYPKHASLTERYNRYIGKL